MRKTGRNLTGEGLRSYTFLARLLLVKGYRGKIFVAVFAGVHVPLISLILYAAFGFPAAPGGSGVLTLLIVALAATLVGTGATLYVLNVLLTPVSVVSQALREYVESGKTPHLPTNVTGREGVLISDLGYTLEQVERLDRAVSMLEDLSSHDYLTGAYNRRGCENRLEEDLARVRRGGSSLTLVVLDVDHFKRINDDHGHQAGDVCLRHVAGVIQDNIRSGDWLARWGGDEFVLALWDAKPTAPAILGRIVAALDENPARPPGASDIRLTISGGVYRCAGDKDAPGCFAAADEALGRAKRTGRNRIIYAS